MEGNNENTIGTVTSQIDKRTDHAADLEQALAVAGVGPYNIRYCITMGFFLLSVAVDSIGYSYVLPAASCELNMTLSQRGFIASVPYIGMVLSSFPWGYLLDTQGRKWPLIYSSLACGTLGILSAFMPNLISFAIFKFFSALCIGCPSSAPYTFIGEVVPAKTKDLLLTIVNCLQITGTVLVPLIAWGILPLDFRIEFGLYEFRSWRLLTIIYASTFIISSFLLLFGPESPKYLVSQGKHEEAIKVLQTIYSRNKRKPVEDYPIKVLISTDFGTTEKQNFWQSFKAQSIPLLSPPYLKWLLLNGFLLFGVFSTVNGLYIWVPDILNRVYTENVADRTACQIIQQRLNETVEETAECTDTISETTYIINAIGNTCCVIFSVVISSSVTYLGKKTLLLLLYTVIGIFCILINVTTKDILFAIFLSSIQVLGINIGPVNAYAVEIFPTYLRGMAISVTMMIGRFGSIFGANVGGLLLEVSCEATFYTFGGLLILCGLLSLILPKSKVNQSKSWFVCKKKMGKINA